MSNQSINFSGKRLLLVEDNHINQMVAKGMLASLGFQIDVCENGQQALDTLANETYELIMMDLQMPVMDGLTATRKIRELGGKFTSLPIIAMTANALPSDVEACRQAGMNAHISKPIDAQILKQTITQWVAGKMVEHDEDQPELDVSELPTINGIDIAVGVQRMNGNWEAYKKVLLSFQQKHHDIISHILQLSEKSSWQEATRQAHTLKGISGNISAMEVHKLASELEISCQQKDLHQVKTLSSEIDTQLQSIFVGINQLDDSNSSITESDKPALTDEQLDETLNLILLYLDEDVSMAQDLTEELQKQCAIPNNKIVVEKMMQKLSSFELDEVRAQIQKILDRPKER